MKLIKRAMDRGILSKSAGDYVAMGAITAGGFGIGAIEHPITGGAIVLVAWGVSYLIRNSSNARTATA